MEGAVLVYHILRANGLHTLGTPHPKQLNLTVFAEDFVFVCDWCHIGEALLAACAVEAIGMIRVSFVLQSLLDDLLLADDAAHNASG